MVWHIVQTLMLIGILQIKNVALNNIIQLYTSIEQRCISSGNIFEISFSFNWTGKNDAMIYLLVSTSNNKTGIEFAVFTIKECTLSNNAPCLCNELTVDMYYCYYNASMTSVLSDSFLYVQLLYNNNLEMKSSSEKLPEMCVKTVEATSSNFFSNALIGVLSTHVMCEIGVIAISVTVFVVVKLKMQTTMKHRLKLLNILCILITIFEIVQIILVAIACVRNSDEGDTILDIWKVMILYQVIVNTIFIIVESITLALNIGIKGIVVDLKEEYFYSATLICIHSMIGIIGLPFLWYFLGKKFKLPKPSKVTPDEHRESISSTSDTGSQSNLVMEKKKPQADAIFNNKINANVSVQENTQDEIDQSGPKKVKKKAKLGKKEHLEKKADTKENKTELNPPRFGTASEIKLKLDETNQVLELKDLPTSIEMTTNPSLVNPRRLPPLKKY